MDLFDDAASPPRNLLPHDGDSRYFGVIMSLLEADNTLTRLLAEIDWQHDKVKLYGREIVTRRKVAWHGDRPFAYTYSHNTKTAAPWTPLLAELKARVEAVSGAHYNCCLLNLYHSGEEGMGWHADDEKELVPDAAIASLSFGPPRRFILRHKADKTKVETLLDHGSLFLMQGMTQRHWEHSLPVMKRVKTARVNLTFRSITD